jgi:transposase InsO family protein
MQKLSKKHGIGKMAELLHVSRSRYYEYIEDKSSIRKLRDKALVEKITISFNKSRKNYGAARIHRELKAQGESVSRKRIVRLMKKNQLIPNRKKLFKVTTKTNSNNVAEPNILNQDFIATKPNHKWVSDITYVWTASGWL